MKSNDRKAAMKTGVTKKEIKKAEETWSVYADLLNELMELKKLNVPQDHIDLIIQRIPEPTCSRLRADLAKKDDPIITIIPQQREIKLEPVQIGLVALKQIYNQVYQDDVPVIISEQDKTALKNINRDARFWRVIQDGFVNGKGILFLNQLKEQGIYSILFPALNPMKQTQDETWFEIYIENIDDNVKNKNEGFFKNPFRTHIQLLLIAKELSSPVSLDQVKMISAAYKTTITLDKAFEEHVKMIAAAKKIIIEQAQVVTQPVASLDYRAKK